MAFLSPQAQKCGLHLLSHLERRWLLAVAVLIIGSGIHRVLPWIEEVLRGDFAPSILLVLLGDFTIFLLLLPQLSSHTLVINGIEWVEVALMYPA